MSWWRTYISGSEDSNNNSGITRSENEPHYLIIPSNKSTEIMNRNLSTKMSESSNSIRETKELVYRSGLWTDEEKQRFQEAIENVPPRDWNAFSRLVMSRSPHQCKIHFRAAIRPKCLKGSWSKDEDETLLKCVDELGMQWSKIVKSFPNRSESSCRYRYYNYHFPNMKQNRWTDEELDKLRELIEQFGNKWSNFSMDLDRSPESLRYQAKTKLTKFRKGPWTKEEDEKLRQLVEKHGKRFNLISKELETRTFYQCQQRWCRSLDPSLRKGPWTEEEDEKLQNAVKLHGKRWLLVMGMIPGRSSDQCRLRHAFLMVPTISSPQNLGVRIDWTEAQDQEILRLRNNEMKPFWEISEIMNLSRSTIFSHYYTLMNRLSGFTRNTSPWTLEEDEKLKELYQFYGNRWASIASRLNTGRLGSQVKLRIQLNLNPDRLTCRWTQEEDEKLENLYNKYGHSWTLIAHLLKTRSPMQCNLRMRHILVSPAKSSKQSALFDPTEMHQVSSTSQSIDQIKRLSLQ